MQAAAAQQEAEKLGEAGRHNDAEAATAAAQRWIRRAALANECAPLPDVSFAYDALFLEILTDSILKVMDFFTNKRVRSACSPVAWPSWQCQGRAVRCASQGC